MKLYLLRHRACLASNNDPWKSPWNKSLSFVVRAKNMTMARHLAQIASHDQTFECNGRKYKVWLEARYTTCIHLEVNGQEGVILENNAGA